MIECKICHGESRQNIRKHEKSEAHRKSLKKAMINKNVRKDTNVDRLKDILNKRLN